MALIGYANKVTADIYSKLMSDEDIVKLLYYNNVLDTDIKELPIVKNPVKELKKKVFMNRRIEQLQRESDIMVSVSVYSKENWKEMGHSHDKTLKNIIEVGVCGHQACDNTVNGSRVLAVIELVIGLLTGLGVESIGQVNFLNMYKTKDLPIEYNGYLMYFRTDNINRGE
jgi:hypothetical protein cdifQCD_20456